MGLAIHVAGAGLAGRCTHRLRDADATLVTVGAVTIEVAGAKVIVQDRPAGRRAIEALRPPLGGQPLFIDASREPLQLLRRHRLLRQRAEDRAFLGRGDSEPLRVRRSAVRGTVVAHATAETEQR